MLRIFRDGKPVPLKEQDKLVNAKGSMEHVNAPVNFDKPAVKAKSKYPGLRPSGGDKKDAKPAKTEKK